MYCFVCICAFAFNLCFFLLLTVYLSLKKCKSVNNSFLEITNWHILPQSSLFIIMYYSFLCFTSADIDMGIYSVSVLA